MNSATYPDVDASANGWMHRRWVEHDHAAQVYTDLVKLAGSKGAVAIIGNLFEVAQNHPEEHTAKALWHHLRIHAR